MYKYITEQGKTLQQQPYQQYQGQLVPDINATQQAGINQAQQYSQAAQPFYQAGYGAAGQAQNILNQDLGVAQPYFQGAQTFAAGTLPQYQQAAGVAQAGMRPLMQSTYAAQPSYQAAQAGTMAAGAGTGQTIGQLGNISQGYNAPNYQAGVQGYMNPYLQNAMGSTAAMMQNQNQQQQNQLQGNAITQGAFGGDRGNIAQAALMGQQNLAMGQTLGQMANTGYQSAAQNYMSGLGQQGALAGQQGAMYGQLGNLSNQYGLLGGQAQQALINAGQAQQQGAANIANIAGQGMGAASQYGALGTAAQNAALQGVPLAQQQATLYGQLGTGAQNAGMTGAQQLSAAGAIPYAVQQAQDAAQYQQFAQQQAYPWQTLGSLANMASGLGAGQGGVSSTTTPGPNSMNSIMGLGTSLLGFMTPSDERLKENMEPIGKTFDGQNLYKYNYKGDPRTQIGLSAQEVEKRNPNAVHKTEGGMRMVDYDDATSNAADRGHFASGGSSMGGLVPESMDRRAFSYGGGYGSSQSQFGQTPYADDPLTEEMAALAKITLGSYIPHIGKTDPGGIPIPTAPKYDAPTFDTSGIEGFGKAYKKYSAANAGSSVLPSYTNGDSGIGGTLNQAMYASGGLVPRVPHANGEAADPEKTVPSDQGFLGGLGSSISKGLGGVFGSDTQPSLLSSTFNKGQPLSDDAKQAIMAAGFGMMASPSPFLSQAIGQGGLIGANTYAKQRNIDYETQKALAEQALRGREISVEEYKAPALIGIETLKNQLGMVDKAAPLFTQTTDTQEELSPGVANPNVGQTVFLGPKGERLTTSQYADRLYGIYKATGLPDAYINAIVATQIGGITPSRTGHALGGTAGMQPTSNQDSSNKLTAPSLVNPNIIGADEGDMTNSPDPIQVAQATITDASQAANVNDKYKDIAPEGLPSVFLNKAAVQRKIASNFLMQKNTAAADAANQLAKTYEDNAKAIDKGEMPTILKNGEKSISQSILDYNRQKAAADKYATDMAATQATSNAEFDKQANTFLDGYDKSKQLLNMMSNIYSKVETNRLSDVRSDLAGFMREFGVDSLAGMDVSEIQSANDLAVKAAVTEAFSVMRENAQKAPATGLREAILTVASPTLAPGARYQLVTSQLGDAMRDKDMYEDWILAGKPEKDTFKVNWKRNLDHQPDVYLQKAADQTPLFKGMTDQEKNILLAKPKSELTGSSGAQPSSNVMPPIPPNLVSKVTGYETNSRQWKDNDGNIYDVNGTLVKKAKP
jgi:hypothetical protein